MTDVRQLEPGLDFRLPAYRREVFMRFYEFHLRWAAHPGAVYYAIPQLFARMDVDAEQRLWMLYLNGCTQNIVTTFLLAKAFPDLHSIDLASLEEFMNDNWKRLQWDVDRRYVKARIVEMVDNYRRVVDGDQQAYFGRLANHDDPRVNFRSVWSAVLGNFRFFGRLSTFSYLEYLRIGGVPLDCDNLFLYDITGSKSHRNGICKVYGRDDLDWTKTNPVRYTPAHLRWATDCGAELLAEARDRIDHPDVSYFTLESTLCCFKGWHRVGRRYPNVYNDMFADRIRWSEERMGDADVSMFWEIRRDFLPAHLRLEDNPRDVGLKPLKQNHYLQTGEVIMMHRDWPCFRNAYNDWVDAA